MNDHFFDIPVYRTSLERFSKDFESWKNSELKKIADWKRTAPGSYENIKNNLIEKQFYPWYFNDVIGWICLYTLGEQVRGDYYFISQKRINKGIIKKRFENCGKAFEINIFRRENSQEIHDKVRNELLSLYEKAPFKKRFIDLKTFDRTFKYIDWRKLIDDNNIYNRK